MAFTVAVIVLGAKMAKADGTVSRTEIDAFKTVFRIPPDEIKNVARIFDAARSDARGFEPYARQMAQLFRNEPSILEDLLAGLFHVARADGEINAQELNYLSKVAQHLGLEPGAFERVRSMFIQGDGIDPYGVLGIDAQTSDEDVKKTYRRLIRENHPDILVAKGMPQEFIDVANQRMAAINAAYDQIEKQRGLK
jgi:DnaJ like chaperone protein